jgi:predicted anti-sigma-YlaC factor YlaD
MTCSESQVLLQQHLDGEPIADRGEVDRHLADCPACRDLYASARRLQECLQSLTSIAPPADLSQRILARWLEERRSQARWRRRLLVGVGVAAALLAAIFLGYSRWRPRGEPETERSGETANQDLGSPDFTDSPTPRIAVAPAGASLNQSVEEAGSALVALLNRTADETVGQGKVLLPATMPTPPLPAPDAWQQTLDPPVESLREAQQNVASGLEPVTSSARRAVNLFLREMP